MAPEIVALSFYAIIMFFIFRALWKMMFVSRNGVSPYLVKDHFDVDEETLDDGIVEEEQQK